MESEVITKLTFYTIIFCLAMAILTSLLTAIGQVSKTIKYGSAHWLPVNANITHSQLNLFTSDMRRTYSANIAFEYSVEGTQYSSNIITPDLESGSGFDKSNGGNLIALFPANAQVRAYYNQHNPSVAVLFPCNTQWSWHTIFYIAFLVFGALMIIPSSLFLFIYFP